GADQTLPLPFVHPVMRTPPLTTGLAPDAACHTMLCPSVPESLALSTSGLDSRYVPVARLTRTSPDVVWSMPRTTSRACCSVRSGADALVPGFASLPVGETKRSV